MTTFLPVEPLRGAILRDREYALEHYTLHAPPNDKGWYALSAWSGIPERSLRRVAQESNVVSLDLADAYCCGTGRHLRDLYPELYDFATPDPDTHYLWPCKTCLFDTYMLIVHEGRLRLSLRCTECGRGHYALRNKRPIIPAFIDAGRANLERGRAIRVERVRLNRDRIRALWEAGVPTTDIAHEFGVRPNTIHTIRWREGWRKRRCGRTEWADEAKGAAA